MEKENVMERPKRCSYGSRVLGYIVALEKYIDYLEGRLLHTEIKKDRDFIRGHVAKPNVLSEEEKQSSFNDRFAKHMKDVEKNIEDKLIGKHKF